MERRCEDCEWYQGYYSILLGKDEEFIVRSAEERDSLLNQNKGSLCIEYGECRIDAPTIPPVLHPDEQRRPRRWPEVKPDDWCGRFDKKITGSDQDEYPLEL